MNLIHLSAFDLGLAALLVVLLGGLIALSGLGLTRSLYVSSLRMTLQLLLIGVVLEGLFRLNNPWLVALMGGVMLAVAGWEVALDLAKEALKDIIGSVRNVGMDNIQKTVADYYKIKVAELFSKKRTRAIARPRQLAMWLCREVTSHSYPEIGDAFGGRDHTTVMYAYKQISDKMKNDMDVQKDIDSIKRKF